MPNEDRNIEHLIIEIESKTEKATKNLEKMLAITERLNKAIHSGGFEKLHEKMSKIAALDVGNAVNFGNAIHVATAKAKGLSDGIGQAEMKTFSLGKNAEKLKSNMEHATEAAKKLEAHLPQKLLPSSLDIAPGLVQNDPYEAFDPDVKVTDHVPDFKYENGTFELGKDFYTEISKSEYVSHKLHSLWGGIKNKLSSAASSADTWLSKIKKVEDSTKRTHSSMSAIKTILLYSGLFTLVSAITKGITSGVQNVAQASEHANDVLSRYQTLNVQLQNSLGSAMIPLLQAAYPLLEGLANILIDVSNAVNIVSSSVAGEKEFMKANKVAQDYATSIAAVKNALAGMDEINVVKRTNTEEMFTSTPISGTDIGSSVGKLTLLLTVLGGLKIITSQLKLASFFGGLSGSLSGFGASAGKLLPVLGAVGGMALFAVGAFDAWTNDVDWGNNIQMVLGLTAAVLGLYKIFGTFGAQIGGIAGGIGLSILGISDSIENGVNSANAALTVGGTTLIGAMVGSFFGPLGTLVGGAIGAVVGGLIDLGVWISQNWGEEIGGFFSDLGVGIKTGFVNVINGIIYGFEAFVNFFVKGINWIVSGINKISFEVPDWVPGIGGKKVGFDLGYVQEISFGRIPAYANGGFVEDGLFMANHNEIIGQFEGGKTAVANNDMIVEGISQGVSEASFEQNELIREQNALLRQLLRKSGSISVSTITRGLERQNRRAGKTVVPVGT